MGLEWKTNNHRVNMMLKEGASWRTWREEAYRTERWGMLEIRPEAGWRAGGGKGGLNSHARHISHTSTEPWRHTFSSVTNAVLGHQTVTSGRNRPLCKEALTLNRAKKKKEERVRTSENLSVSAPDFVRKWTWGSAISSGRLFSSSVFFIYLWALSKTNFPVMENKVGIWEKHSTRY